MYLFHASNSRQTQENKLWGCRYIVYVGCVCVCVAQAPLTLQTPKGDPESVTHLIPV